VKALEQAGFFKSVRSFVLREARGAKFQNSTLKSFVLELASLALLQEAPEPLGLMLAAWLRLRAVENSLVVATAVGASEPPDYLWHIYEWSMRAYGT
jgi:hypothetical protein